MDNISLKVSSDLIHGFMGWTLAVIKMLEKMLMFLKREDVYITCKTLHSVVSIDLWMKDNYSHILGTCVRASERRDIAVLTFHCRQKFENYRKAWRPCG